MEFFEIKLHLILELKILKFVEFSQKNLENQPWLQNQPRAPNSASALTRLWARTPSLCPVDTKIVVITD
jgi:hypothetical protein